MIPAAAITHQDNLEFLDDTIPKTQPYREVKQKAAETRAKLSGASAGYPPPEPTSSSNTHRKRPKKQRTPVLEHPSVLEEPEVREKHWDPPPENARGGMFEARGSDMEWYIPGVEKNMPPSGWPRKKRQEP